MTARIAPAEPPFPAGIQSSLDALMRGKPPLVLFTTLARDPRLFQKFFASGLLDRGNLTLRQRELVIDRTTALCQSEYEWGVHIALFASRVGFDEAQVGAAVADCCNRVAAVGGRENHFGSRGTLSGRCGLQAYQPARHQVFGDG